MCYWESDAESYCGQSNLISPFRYWCVISLGEIIVESVLSSSCVISVIHMTEVGHDSRSRPQTQTTDSIREPGLKTTSKSRDRDRRQNSEGFTELSNHKTNQACNFKFARRQKPHLQHSKKKHSHHARHSTVPNIPPSLPWQLPNILTILSNHSALPSAGPYSHPAAPTPAHTPHHQSSHPQSYPLHTHPPPPRHRISSPHHLRPPLAEHHHQNDTHP